jgi:protein-L-isoaspartate O-methyltransferase
VTSNIHRNFSAPFPLLHKLLRSFFRRHGPHEAMELVYRELFVRELARLGIEDRFFPTGSAANHSLLYLVLRCYVELPLARILDVGAGQTSLLLDALQRRLGKSEVITLEHDPAWAARIAAQVAHPVLCRELVDMRIGGRRTRMHDLAGLSGPFQLIIMDAPGGTRRYSRLGLVRLMETVMDRRDFVAILDDADRSGEMQTIAACRQWLREEGLAFREKRIMAAKWQWLCAAGALEHAAYF